MKLKRYKDNFDIWENSSTTIYFDNKKRKNKFNIILKIIGLFILSLFFILIININYTSESYVYNKYYYSIEKIRPPIKRGENKNYDAFLKYEEGDFKSASFLFKEILNKNYNNIPILFYYGVSNMEIENYEESIKSFKYILEENNNSYVEHAGWYLGLCYLKTDYKKESIEIFLNISKDYSNYYNEKAKKILKEISD